MHNSYVVPGVDEQVLKAQAERRAADKRSPEETTIHYHKHGLGCVPKCYIVHVPKPEEGINVATPDS